MAGVRSGTSAGKEDAMTVAPTPEQPSESLEVLPSDPTDPVHQPPEEPNADPEPEAEPDPQF